MLILLFSLFATSAFAEKLELLGYLHQVEVGSSGYIATDMASQAALLRKWDPYLPSYPSLFGSMAYVEDERQTDSPSVQGKKSRFQNYQIGITQLTPFGLSAKIYSSFNRYAVDFDPTSPPLPAVSPIVAGYQTSHAIELNQNFWRNGFGSEFRAQRDAAANAIMASHYGNAFKTLNQLVEAETSYWRLSIARKTISVQKELLARAEKIYDWAKKRTALQLGDKADMLQAQASLELRKLDLQTALEEETAAGRAFNSLRNVDGDKVGEEIEIVNPDQLETQKIPSSYATRLDVKAAEAQQKATIANAQADKEKVKPTFDLFGSLVFSGKNMDYATSFRDSRSSKYPMKTIGLRLTIPLAPPIIYHNHKGTEMEKDAAELVYEQKLRDEQKDWQDLIQRLSDAKRRLSLLHSIEKIQKEKSENENERLMRGRSTTYQALQYEQDYAQAQLFRVKVQAEILSLLAKLKLFGES